MPKTKKIVIDLVKLGRAGGLKRAKNMTEKARSASASKAAKARWAKKPKGKVTKARG